MSKHVTSVLAAVILTLTLSALAIAQTTTTTTTQKTVVQNPDGTYTVIEYPVKKEITLNLTPVTIQGAKGVATILRDDDGTITPLGPIAITNGVGELAATTPLSKFMLIASPEAALTAYDPNTKIFFRSAVPEGLAVIPLRTNPEGEKVAAVAAPATTVAGAYTAPLLGVPSLKTGDDTKIKVDF